MSRPLSTSKPRQGMGASQIPADRALVPSQRRRSRTTRSPQFLGRRRSFASNALERTQFFRRSSHSSQSGMDRAHLPSDYSRLCERWPLRQLACRPPYTFRRPERHWQRGGGLGSGCERWPRGWRVVYVPQPQRNLPSVRLSRGCRSFQQAPGCLLDTFPPAQHPALRPPIGGWGQAGRDSVSPVPAIRGGAPLVVEHPSQVACWALAPPRNRPSAAQ